MQFRTVLVSSIVSALATLSSVAVAKTPRDLGTLGGSSSFARGMNDAGVVVGDSAVGSGNLHAFIYRPWARQMADLSPNAAFASANAVSNSGLAVGVNKLDESAYCGSAVIWDTNNGRLTVLPDLEPGLQFACSQAIAVNDQGVVVGSSNTNGGYSLPVLWKNGKLVSLGSLGGSGGFATAINAQGVVVGQSRTAGDEFHGFIWKNGVMTDIGTLGGDTVTVSGINSRCQVVGYGPTASGALHAFLWENGVMRDLTPNATYANARAISDSGLLAGEGAAAESIHALFWDHSRTLVDLGTLPGGSFSSAFAVNNAGTVAGVSYVQTSDGATSGFHAVIWN